MNPEEQFYAPPFDIKRLPLCRYDWWAWHPAYPQWARSCWGGKTLEEAEHALERLSYNPFHGYAVKLIKETDSGFEVISERETDTPENWKMFYERERNRKSPK